MPNNNQVPGITYPTIQSTGAGSPKDAAIANNNAMVFRQSQANRMTAGRRRRKKGGAITVGVPPLSYTPTGGPGQDPTSIIQKNAQYGAQGSVNATFDKNALKGGRRKRKGGNPDWNWGCSSGGKRKKTRKYSRKTRKHTRRYRK
jgi:hypothetical protein